MNGRAMIRNYKIRGYLEDAAGGSGVELCPHYFRQDNSISSSVRPFVSGKSSHTSRNVRAEHAP